MKPSERWDALGSYVCGGGLGLLAAGGIFHSVDWNVVMVVLLMAAVIQGHAATLAGQGK